MRGWSPAPHLVHWLVVGGVAAVVVDTALMPFEESGAPAWIVESVSLGVPGAIVLLGVRSGRPPGRFARAIARGFPWTLLVAALLMLWLAASGSGVVMAIVGALSVVLAAVSFRIVHVVLGRAGPPRQNDGHP